MKIAIIQLARLGDIANILPICYELHRRGHDVHFYVSADYASILEAVSYVTPHILFIGYQDVAGAIEQARKDGGYDKIVATQVDGNGKNPPTECENFTLQSWARAGVEWLPEYQNLPLIFDKRDEAAEKEAIERCLPSVGDQPVLAYNLHGTSSPFLHFAVFEKWLRSTFGGKFIIVDIGPTGSPCRKPQHLLGLIERASVLVTVDTATLHLGYAVKTPTIALSPGRKRDGSLSRWYDSERRGHWIEKLSYSEALTDGGKERIAAAIRKARDDEEKAKEANATEKVKAAVYKRIDRAAGKTALFLPFVGEVGWLVMWHMRLVHFNQAKRKIVCCHRGQECLFPSANEFFYDWADPVDDAKRAGNEPMCLGWPSIEAKYPKAIPVPGSPGGGLSMDEEMIPVYPERRIPLKPKVARGLKVDVCIGVRNRKFLEGKNYHHWPKIASWLRDRGLTYAVIGSKESSYPLPGMLCMSGDYDWSAAIELLQSCKLFIGTDSGGAHLASVVNACPMIVQAVPSIAATTTRCFIPRMAMTTDYPVVSIPDKEWNKPEAIIAEIERMLK